MANDDMEIDEAQPQPQQQEPPLHPLKGVAGLANLGNTCYANATLQALRHTDDLTSFIMQDRWKELVAGKTSHEAAFVAAYADLVNCLWSATGPGFIRPLGFWEPMEKSARAAGFDQFCERSPQDSHEFMMFVLDMLHEGLKREVLPMTISMPPESLNAKALHAWRQAFQKSYSPLVDMFFGLYLLTTTCQGCGKESHRFDTFNCLKGAIEGTESHSLLECIKNEMRGEEIEDFDCPSCRPVRQKAKLQRTFWKLPQYMAVSIKRFHGVGDKKRNPIEKPPENLTFGQLFEAASPEESRGWNYVPYAVVDHHGSYFGGHYTSQAYSSVQKAWYLYDDESFHKLEQGPIFGSSTYMIFLRRA